MDLSAYGCPNINYERKLQYVKSTAARIESRVVTMAAYFLTPIYTSSEKRQLISDYIKGTLVAAFRSPPMKALERSVETLGLWIVTSAVTSIKSANQSSIKPCLIVHLVSVWTLTYFKSEILSDEFKTSWRFFFSQTGWRRLLHKGHPFFTSFIELFGDSVKRSHFSEILFCFQLIDSLCEAV